MQLGILFQVNLIQLLIISTIFNGLIFCVLLLRKKENRYANRFLSLLLLALCLTFTPFAINKELYNQFLWLSWMPFSLTYWIGPSFYFYVKSITFPAFRIRKKDFWHFTPIILNYLHSGYHSLFHWSAAPWFHYFAELMEFCALISIVIYFFMAFRIISGYQKSILNQVSNLDSIQLSWVKQVIIVLGSTFALITLYLVVVNGVISRSYDPGSYSPFLQALLFLYSIVIYWLAIGGYRQTQVENSPPSGFSVNADRFKDTIETLMAAMESDRHFLDPMLSLKMLGKKTGLSEKDISAALNEHLGKNFYTFINEYRVKEVSRLLRDPKNTHLKIVELAYDAGFNSKATFNRIFKEYTGKSPNEFRTHV